VELADFLVRVRHPALLAGLCYSRSPFWAIAYDLPAADLVSVRSVLEKEAEGRPVTIRRSDGSEVAWDNTKKAICVLGIASGMRSLHEHGFLHQRLKSEIIILDLQAVPWIAAIQLRDEKQFDFDRNPPMPFHVAPEMLGEEWPTATMESDVYAYGMFLDELCTCEKPFAREGGLTAFKWSALICPSRRLEVPWDVPARIAELMQRCWEQHPYERPTFRQIVTVLSEEDFVWEDTDPTEYGDYRAMILSALGDPPPEANE
jgi:serine/threonine protein kinase